MAIVDNLVTPIDRSFFQLKQSEADVVRELLFGESLSRTDLANLLGVSRASITTIINNLIKKGFLVEVGHGQSAGGRRPQLMDINGQIGFVAGVDIGATSVDIALADFKGTTLKRYCEPADVNDDPEIILERVCDIVESLMAETGGPERPLVAAGIGVPGPVQFSKGVLIAPPLMPKWEGYPIREYISERFPLVDAVVDNDVNIMAKGEQVAGGGQGIDNFLFVKIGTGIGCGIISNNAVYRGSDGCAGDIGHICIDYNGPICRCGNPGCLEYMAAGPAIAQAAQKGALAGDSRLLAQRMQGNNGQLTAQDVGEAAANGDRLANEIIRESGRRIGGVLAGLVNFFNPRVIIIGGGVSKIGHQFLSSIRQATLKRATALSTRQLRIEYSVLGDDAGIIGAIWLALENIIEIEDS
ncbi:MAG: ROK family transcriptional regulator [Candidatus Promineifilaceae bacterium]|nr:ROK family transcriptional regulator [Candidatus Promineifilaceae bacterium]